MEDFRFALAVSVLAVLSAACGDFKEEPSSGFTEVRIQDSTPPKTLDLLQDFFEEGGEDHSIGLLTNPTQGKIVVAEVTGSNHPTAVEKLTFSNNSVSFYLANGTWDFFLLGYDQADMAGSPICAYSASNALVGGSYPVTLTGGACESTSLHTPSVLASVHLQVCTGNIVNANPGTIASNCAANSAGANDSTYQSVRYYLPIMSGDVNLGMSSACVTLTNGLSSGSPPIIPVSKMRVALTFHTTADCSGAPGKIFRFERGFSTATGAVATGGVKDASFTDISEKAKLVSDGSAFKVFIQNY